MLPRNKTVVLIQKSVWDELALGAVECDRVTVVDLNCVNAFIRSDRPIDLDVSACLTISKLGGTSG